MKVQPKVSDAEWEVMKAIWRREPCTAQDVIESLAEAKAWTPPTIKTLLNRLVAKGALRFSKQGRAYVYSATVGEHDLRQIETESFMARVFDGALSPLLAHFTRSGRRLRPEDIAALEKLLHESKKRP